jgi:hypothetical protein
MLCGVKPHTENDVKLDVKIPGPWGHTHPIDCTDRAELDQHYRGLGSLEKPSGKLENLVFIFHSVKRKKKKVFPFMFGHFVHYRILYRDDNRPTLFRRMAH